MLADLYAAEGRGCLRKGIARSYYELERSIRYQAALSLVHRINRLKVVRDNLNNIHTDEYLLHDIVDLHLVKLEKFKSERNAEFRYLYW